MVLTNSRGRADDPRPAFGVAALHAGQVGVPPEFQLAEQRVDGRVVIAAHGEIDLATVGGLDAAVARALASDARDLWIDLTGVEFIDSTGLTAIVRAHKGLNDGRRLAVICPPGPARRAFEISGLDGHVSLFLDRAAVSAAG
jgi:anti-sigma B factor antagonist